MSFDRVKTAVLEEAKAEAAKLVTTAKHEGERYLAAGLAEAERNQAETVRELQLRNDRETARILGRVRHEGRLSILEAKNHAIDEVFRLVRQRIADMEPHEYLELIKRWLLAIPAESQGFLRANPRDVELLRQNLEAINNQRPATGKFTHVEEDQSVNLGVKVEGADFTADCTADRQLLQLRESAAGDLARVLFGA